MKNSVTMMLSLIVLAVILVVFAGGFTGIALQIAIYPLALMAMVLLLMHGYISNAYSTKEVEEKTVTSAKAVLD